MDIIQFRKDHNYDATTKVMQQYLDIKYANLECLLLFRMGDFYEFFYEDAVLAAKILGLVLTKRGKDGEKEIAMCGLPFHAVENYLKKLLEEGFKVAICEQIETPEEAKRRNGYKAIIKREVTRIITPGTLVEESLLEGSTPNYLSSLVIGKNSSSICNLNLSTSKIFVIDTPADQIINELVRIKPSEILLSEKFKSDELCSDIEMALSIHISFQVDNFFAEKKCKKVIEDYYKIVSVDAIGEFNSNQISAIGSILEYISLTQKNNLPHLPVPKMLSSQEFMIIDSRSRHNLEITSSLNGNIKGSLFYTINHTLTKGGSRLLHEYLSFPSIKRNKINERLSITNFFFKNIKLTDSLRKVLSKTPDLERSLTRIQMQRGSPKDLLVIRDSIFIASQVKTLINGYGIDLPEKIKKISSLLENTLEVADLINNAIKDDAPNVINDGDIIKTNFHSKIKDLRTFISSSHEHLNILRNKYRKETGIENLKILFNNTIGWFIEITTRNYNKITDKKFIHKQKTTNSVRYTTKELQGLESKILNVKNILIALEKKIYSNICQKTINCSSKLISLATAINELDLFLNFAFIAYELEYCLPLLTNKKVFKIEGGRHPVVEKFLKSNSRPFTKNNCDLNDNEIIWLITGPNMAGKSTFLRQNAIIAILAHIGSFVPAISAEIGIVDKIFSRVGAGDNLTKGHSTFMVEMVETSAILAQSTENSLIILDEVGRGTSTYDGVAIAWSVLEHIHNKIKARCLFATHYHELTSLSDILNALTNYTVSISEDNQKIIFLYKIIKGLANRSYGVHVAQIAGLPISVIQRANQLLLKFENESAKSNKQIFKASLKDSSDFEEKDKTISNYKKVYDFCRKINPDELSPRAALDTIYKIKTFIV